jgi:excinuclease ABC subunit C
MARLRGVSGQDRSALAGSIAAILERRPAAVSWAHRELEQLRESAAENLAYERAARIQEEIGALGWVCSLQRVTSMDTTDGAVAGWSEGVLVEFLIRGGKLCAWWQRSCERGDAAAAVAAAPAAWREFAKRNAELAARLA